MCYIRGMQYVTFIHSFSNYQQKWSQHNKRKHRKPLQWIQGCHKVFRGDIYTTSIPTHSTMMYHVQPGATSRYVPGVWCTIRVDEGRASRQTAAVSLAQLQLMTNTTNTDTLHQYPKVLVWVTAPQFTVTFHSSPALSHGGIFTHGPPRGWNPASVHTQ